MRFICIVAHYMILTLFKFFSQHETRIIVRQVIIIFLRSLEDYSIVRIFCMCRIYCRALLNRRKRRAGGVQLFSDQMHEFEKALGRMLTHHNSKCQKWAERNGKRGSKRWRMQPVEVKLIPVPVKIPQHFASPQIWTLLFPRLCSTLICLIKVVSKLNC